MFDLKYKPIQALRAPLPVTPMQPRRMHYRKLAQLRVFLIPYSLLMQAFGPKQSELWAAPSNLPSTNFFLWRCDPTRVMVSSFLRFLDHTQQRTTFGRTPLDEWSACRRDFSLTTHNTHNRQTSMLPVGFEPTISAGERPQTYALDRANGCPRCLYSKVMKPHNNNEIVFKLRALGCARF
jgi:hypothetical protein